MKNPPMFTLMAMLTICVVTIILLVFAISDYQLEYIAKTGRISELEMEILELEALLEKVYDENLLIDKFIDKQRDMILNVLKLKEGEEEIEKTRFFDKHRNSLHSDRPPRLSE